MRQPYLTVVTVATALLAGLVPGIRAGRDDPNLILHTKLASTVCVTGCQQAFSGIRFEDYPPEEDQGRRGRRRKRQSRDDDDDMSRGSNSTVSEGDGSDNSTMSGDDGSTNSTESGGGDDAEGGRDNYVDPACVSTLFQQSLAACSEVHCKLPLIYSGWASVGESCEDWPEFDDVVKMLPALDTIEEYDILGEKSGMTFNETILPDAAAFKVGYDTTAFAQNEADYEHIFGWSILVFAGAMWAFGLLFRLIKWIEWRVLTSASSVSPRADMSPHNGPASRINTMYKKHLGMPALFNNRHGRSAWFMFSIPTRIQFLWVFIYVALNIIFSFVGYKVFEGNLLYPGVPSQIVYYLSERTGAMSFYNMALLWLLGGRNDFLLWGTGTSFSTLNLFHRWASRITVLQASAHSIGYVWLYRGRLESSWKEKWWVTGVFATILWVIMIGAATLPIRKWSYELFLLFHIGAAAASLYLLYAHVAPYGTPWNPWIWACVATWVFDRFVRLVRLGALSYNAVTSSNSEAIVTGADHGLIRLSVTMPFKFQPKAGSYYFLYSPMTLTPWENHPFTLGSWDNSGDKTKLEFLIAAQSGATKRLRRKIKNNPTNMRILLEGPYGHAEEVERYEHVLCIAGGSGITAILPYLEMLKKNPFTRSVTMVWTVKNNAYTTDIMSKELSGCNAEIIIHITEEEMPAAAILPAIDAVADSENAAAEKKMGGSDSDSDTRRIQVTVGRPSFTEIVMSHADRLVGSERLAVISCGPGGMVDDLRKSIVNALGNGEGAIHGDQIHYFEELFSW